jgi:Zn-dependent protease with chaperone function
MTTTLRAALSVLILAGFYVLALALVVGCAIVAWVSGTQGHASGAFKWGLLTIIVTVGIVVALVRVARASRAAARAGSGSQREVTVSPDQAPELWAVVRELAAAADTRVPDQILLMPDVNAGVTEETRMLGLVGGRRRLYLGVPLLQGMTVAQLRSVLAHELGHYSNAHTRLAPVAYRSREVVATTAVQLRGNIVGLILNQYAKLFFAVSFAVSRSQELEADRVSVQVAGRETAQGALRELPVLDAAWSFYDHAYLDLGWHVGYAPTAHGFFGGFGEFLAARSDELDHLRGEVPPERRSRWDSHPPVSQRIAAMDNLPDVAVPVDRRVATALIPGFDAAAAAVADAMIAFGDRKRLEWGELVAASSEVIARRGADRLFRAAAEVGQRPAGHLGLVLDLVEQGWFAVLARAMAPEAPVEEQAEQTTMAIEAALRVATVRSGVGVWQGSWSEPVQVVDANGTPIALDQVAQLASTQSTLPAAREWLAAAGIDVAANVRQTA